MDATLPAAVLWDMDGTLIDSEPQWIESQVRLVEEHGGVWTRDDGLRLVGADMAATAIALQSAGVPDDEATIIERLTREVVQALTTSIEWRPGAVELVRELHGAGVPQAIVTTSGREMARLVAEALPAGAIRTVVSGDEVRRGKPHPEPYLTAAARLGVDIAECVAVEDSATGLTSAIAAGAIPIGVPHDTAIPTSREWMRVPTLAGCGLDVLTSLARRHVARRRDG